MEGPVVTGVLEWYTNQADFEAAAAARGKVNKAVETFEESTQQPNGNGSLNDPLSPGVPNGPFPNGLEGAPNLRVQSNLSGGNPVTPNPRGVDGLVNLSAGFGGAVSDLVMPNFFADSLDLQFSGGNKTAVGGNTVEYTNGGPLGVDIRVYDTSNAYLGQMHFSSNIQGTFFAGVISDVPIGRINVYSPNNAGEGLDNIQLWYTDVQESHCLYRNKRVKAQACNTCPQFTHECDISTPAVCGSVKDCRKRIKQVMACPDNPDGWCKVLHLRCDCK